MGEGRVESLGEMETHVVSPIMPAFTGKGKDLRNRKPKNFFFNDAKRKAKTGKKNKLEKILK